MTYVALRMAYYRQSKRRTAEFLGALLGQPCCPALTVKIEKEVTAALRPSYEALAAELPTQKQLNIDETATKEENGKARPWTFVDRMLTVFAVRAMRAKATALTEFLGETFCGVVTCDRAKMFWQLGWFAVVLSAFERDFQVMIDSGDRREKHLGWRLRHVTCELFEHWADYRAGKISRAACCVAWGRSVARWSVCCCAAPPKRQSRRARHVPGVVRASPVALDAFAL